MPNRITYCIFHLITGKAPSINSFTTNISDSTFSKSFFFPIQGILTIPFCLTSLVLSPLFHLILSLNLTSCPFILLFLSFEINRQFYFDKNLLSILIKRALKPHLLKSYSKYKGLYSYLFCIGVLPFYHNQDIEEYRLLEGYTHHN